MAKKLLRGVLVDVENETVGIVEIEDKLNEFYRILIVPASILRCAVSAPTNNIESSATTKLSARANQKYLQSIITVRFSSAAISLS